MEIWYFLYVSKRGISFSTNMKLHFCQKSKDDLSSKNTLKDYISRITEKDDINPRKDGTGILERVPIIICTFL